MLRADVSTLYMCNFCNNNNCNNICNFLLGRNVWQLNSLWGESIGKILSSFAE